MRGVFGEVIRTFDEDDFCEDEFLEQLSELIIDTAKKMRLFGAGLKCVKWIEDEANHDV